MIWILELVLLCLLAVRTCLCEQWMLHNTSWSDKFNKEYRLKIVTVATEKSDGLSRFLRSTKLFGLDVEVFGLDGDWQRDDIVDEPGGYMKINLLRKSLAKYKDDARLILMFTDSYETIFTAGKEEILRKFRRSSSNIFISAEDYCWDDRSLKTRYLIKNGDGFRYLCSGGIIGFAPHVYKILTLTLHTPPPTDDFQLGQRFNFSDDRKKYSIRWDRRSDLFQNLNDGYKKHIELKFNGSNVRIVNTGYKTEPVVIHGNGHSRTHFNWHLANYAPNAWSHKKGCMACKEDTINLGKIPLEKWPTVVMGIFINQLTPFVHDFLRHISDLYYPKEKIDIYIRNAEEFHDHEVETWVQEFKLEYKSIFYEKPSTPLTNQQARNLGIYQARKLQSDYYFSIDSDVTMTNQNTLARLMEQNRPFLAAMLTHPTQKWNANFWGDMDKDGNYLRSPDFYEITNRTRRGVWNVPYVSDLYLIKRSVVMDISITPFHSPEYDAYIQFCSHLREKGVFMYLTNMVYFGHLKNMKTFTSQHKHNDMYQLFDNVLDWEEKYLHEDFQFDVKRDRVKQPCPDVFSVPVFSKVFGQHLIEEFVHKGEWFLNEHIKGGYENVPTSELRNIGFDGHWFSMLRQYFNPMAERLFPGYVTKSQSKITVVAQHWWSHDERANLPLFNDTSAYTINIALNQNGIDFQGGGERYIRYNCVADTKLGWALMRPGSFSHQYETLKSKGDRYTLVSFIDP